MRDNARKQTGTEMPCRVGDVRPMCVGGTSHLQAVTGDDCVGGIGRVERRCRRVGERGWGLGGSGGSAADGDGDDHGDESGRGGEATRGGCPHRGDCAQRKRCSPNSH